MGIKGSFTFISFPWQSKSVWHKRYSDCNSAAIMLDRTRGEKKKEKAWKILESLLSPASDVIRPLGPDATPKDYLKLLDS